MTGTDKRVTRKEAIRLRLKRYHSDKPCKRGHTGERYVSCYGCIQCYRAISPTRISYNMMIARCTRPKTHGYKWYGQRGIKVCDRWLAPNGQGYRAFVADIGERPPGTSLDRTDNDGDYTPGNVRWVARRQQQRNRSNTRTVRIDGEDMCLLDAAEKLGIKRATIYTRMSRKNITAQQAVDEIREHGLLHPGRPGMRLIVRGQIMSQRQAAMYLGVDPASLRSKARHRYNGDVQAAVDSYLTFGRRRAAA